MAGKSYVVSAPLATPYREDGTRAYLYQGSEWPEGLRDGETERFVDLGFVSELPADAKSPRSRSAKSDD